MSMNIQEPHQNFISYLQKESEKLIEKENQYKIF